MYNGEQHHEGKFSHEFASGAASFGAMKAYEDHQRKNGSVIALIASLSYANLLSLIGKPVSHAFAKELIAGFVGGEVDKLAETKGMDWVDREKAKHHAKQNAHEMYEERYERGGY